MTKKNKPFGVLTLEDYSDTASIFLFSDDYVKYKDYLVVGWHLYIQGKVMERPYRQGEFEFKISRIELLSDLREKMAKSFTINVPQENVNEKLVERLSEISKLHKGKCDLKINLIDQKNNVALPLLSRTRRVDISDEFISKISDIKEIKYSIN